MSCVEHLCDSLCYQLDLASFVSCVNSGQSWNSKSSLLLSGNQQIISASEDNHSERFVENFVLERLSVQSPLRVSLLHLYGCVHIRCPLQNSWTCLVIEFVNTIINFSH